MTCIANYPTKRAFQRAVESNPRTVLIEDPAINDPWVGNIEDALTRKGELLVTNHPRRSWFARVTRRDGKYRVR